MIRFSRSRIDQLIAEDVPYIDLTSIVLGIGGQAGLMEYFTRERCVLAGVSAVREVMERLGCEVVWAKADGSELEEGKTFLRVRGEAADLHAAWRVCLNLFDHLSAVATKTKGMVDAVHEVNPHCEILVTRKSMPGAKDLLIDAVMAGGAFPHRLGLSETVLVFDHHIAFLGGMDEFLRQVPEIKARCIEKKLFVEAGADEAMALVEAGVDGIQLEKLPPDEIVDLVKALRSINPNVTLVAAGGVNPQNAAAYAASGVDGLATTAPFTAKPVDMSVRMIPL